MEKATYVSLWLASAAVSECLLWNAGEWRGQQGGSKEAAPGLPLLLLRALPQRCGESDAVLCLHVTLDFISAFYLKIKFLEFKNKVELNIN